MPNFDIEQMDSMQYDILREIGNIGAGNATTALAKMLRVKVDIGVPDVKLLSFQELPDIVGGAETIVAGILVYLEGDIEGMMMFMMEKTSARHIVDRLMGMEHGETEEFDEMSLSALSEIGNIIGGAYLSSLSMLTNMNIVQSVPNVAMDMAGAILDVPAVAFGQVGDKALLIQTQFLEDQEKLNGFFILVPTLDSYGKILSSLCM